MRELAMFDCREFVERSDDGNLVMLCQRSGLTGHMVFPPN